MVQYDAI